MKDTDRNNGEKKLAEALGAPTSPPMPRRSDEAFAHGVRSKLEARGPSKIWVWGAIPVSALAMGLIGLNLIDPPPSAPATSAPLAVETLIIDVEETIELAELDESWPDLNEDEDEQGTLAFEWTEHWEDTGAEDDLEEGDLWSPDIFNELDIMEDQTLTAFDEALDAHFKGVSTKG